MCCFWQASEPPRETGAQHPLTVPAFAGDHQQASIASFDLPRDEIAERFIRFFLMHAVQIQPRIDGHSPLPQTPFEIAIKRGVEIRSTPMHNFRFPIYRAAGEGGAHREAVGG